ncbi:sigma-70 family RNA polymerase sigma factor [Flavobacterium sp. Sd200]|uniref:RNA polymerase sigma factor n=1 Tax=Flavobacterium sp. Sd200 TaxID=2692211 RepID=UPI0013711087|nr:RNA polymerase sigma factor [Flavobacterium sp. Sd200]MXN91021.1 sigma-70 family RNA polymerase sigma factor [Flavobacterium sp. Sd200]
MDQEKIIKGCIKYNSHAQRELYLLYKDRLFMLSLKYCRNEAEAEDNLHNAFIEIFTNIGNYKGKGSFEGWLKRITINKAVNSYKKTLQLVPVKEDIPDDVTVTDEEMNLPADYILALVQQLPDQYRLVFSLYEFDDYSHKEIAAMLSISESTSKSNLHRAKAILKEKITNRHSHPNYIISNGK